METLASGIGIGCGHENVSLPHVRPQSIARGVTGVTVISASTPTAFNIGVTLFTRSRV